MNSNDYYTKKQDDTTRKKGFTSNNKPLTFFLIIVAIIFVMSVFFKINKIEVEGNSLYTAEDIVNASGIQKGDNLFFTNRIAAGSRVVVKLPYVDEVQITRSLPNLLTIIVKESEACACISVDDELWTISKTGKCLSVVSEEESTAVPRISGIKFTDAEVGELIKVSKADKVKLSYLLEILDQIQGRGVISKVEAINMSDNDCPTFEYDGRFFVKFGKYDDTEYNFSKLLSAIDKLSEDDAGTLTIPEGNKVTFNPN